MKRAPSIEKSLLSGGQSVRHALESIGASAAGTLFVVGKNRILQGVVTDGDLRRWILKGGNLAAPVEGAMNREPVVLPLGHSDADARERMTAHRVACLPVIDERRRVVSLVRWIDFFKPKVSARGIGGAPVVIMAGGQGRRLSPITHILPKPLVPIGDKPIIDHIVERFRAQGAGVIYLSIHFGARLVKAYLHDSGRKGLRYVEEKKPLGTAGSLGLLRGRINRTFWVTNCDILVDVDFSDVMRVHRTNRHAVTLVGSMKHYTIPYGVCRLKANGAWEGITEKPGYDFLVNTGVYVVEPRVLKHVPLHRPLPFTDLLDILASQGEKIGVYPIPEKAWMDMGEMEELKKMSRHFGVSL